MAAQASVRPAPAVQERLHKRFIERRQSKRNQEHLLEQNLEITNSDQALISTPVPPTQTADVLESQSTPQSQEKPKAHKLIDQLAREVRHLETASRRAATEEVISTGCPELDACLPHQGYVPGTIVEYLRAAPACGASYLAFAAASLASQTTKGYIVVVDNHDIRHNIYPPTLSAHGIDLNKVIFVRPQSLADAIWAVDQSLRNPAVSAVVAELERIDDLAARRLQLAAESSTSLGIFLRSAAARLRPSWAEVQWLVSSQPRRVRSTKDDSLGTSPIQQFISGSTPTSSSVSSASDRLIQVQLLRNRGGKPGAQLHLEINSTTGKIQSTTKSPQRTNEKEITNNVAARGRNRHEQKASLRLASKLANPKNPGRRTAAS